MANSSSLQLRLIVFSILVAAGLIYYVDGAGGREEDWSFMSMKTAAACGPGSSIADCMAAGGEEFALDSESNKRRMLGNSDYISYGALQRNTVPCSRRGASYYNCQPGAPANPYTRGCSAITRCRS